MPSLVCSPSSFLPRQAENKTVIPKITAKMPMYLFIFIEFPSSAVLFLGGNALAVYTGSVYPIDSAIFLICALNRGVKNKECAFLYYIFTICILLAKTKKVK